MVTQQIDNIDVFKALADPTRREILTLLRHGGQSVNAIANNFSVSRPAISKHLRLLRQANLVVETEDGRHRVYYVNAKPLEEVDHWLEDYRKMWKSKLKNLKSYIEAKKTNKRS